MGQALGLVTAGLQLGLEAILVKPKRSIGPFSAYVTFEETHEDELMMTEHPVETGAKITDHSYKLPPKVTIKCGWSNSPTSTNVLGSLLGAITGTIGGISAILGGNSKSQVKDTYLKLVALQESRVPFDVLTGKRAYTNMLIRSLRVDTDKNSENALIVTATLQQIILVTVKTIKGAQSVPAPAPALKFPQICLPTTDLGIKSLLPSPNFSLKSIRGIVMDATIPKLFP